MAVLIAGFANGNELSNGFSNVNGLSNGFDFRSMGNSGMMSMNNEEIITLSQAVQMIRKVLSCSKNDEMLYEKLIKLAPTDRDREIIKDIKEDDMKHNRILRDVYFSLTGQMAMDDRQMQPNMQQHMTERDDKNDKTDKHEMCYEDLLEMLLFKKLDNVVMFRRIMSVMPMGENYTLLMSIMTDELKNASKINYLIHRSK